MSKNTLQGKKIILGVTGSIAAYKTALLIRLLKEAQAEVKVIQTPFSKKFIPPLTLATLSENPVVCDFFDEKDGTWTNHVDLGLWADLFIVGPASANTISKMTSGICDNMLIATYLSARCPVVIAPAMDEDMYKHPSTKKNLSLLQEYGNHIIEAKHGKLASGLVGKGRMAEPEEIIDEIDKIICIDKPFLNKKVLVTLGATREYIDKVRFISNGSSGKMGMEIAKSFQSAGAEVEIINGSIEISIPETVKNHAVISAEEMYDKTTEIIDQFDIVIFAAAVSDITPQNQFSKKLKKDHYNSEAAIPVKFTTDIAFKAGTQKKENQFFIGFALESDNELDNAKKKLKKKNLDAIILNSLQEKGAGFGFDTNKITIIDHQSITNYPLKSKSKVAEDIVLFTAQKLNLNRP